MKMPDITTQMVPIWQTLAVIGVAVLGAYAGRYFWRIKSMWWTVGYLIPLFFIAVIAVVRWVPYLEFVAPFSWLMAERTEYVLLAFTGTMILTVPLSRIKNPAQEFCIVLFTILQVLLIYVPIFLLPAFNMKRLAHNYTIIDKDKVCLQRENYTCGPAAAVTALWRFNIAAEEGELAILAKTTHYSGTPPDSLCAAINRKYGAKGVICKYEYFKSIDEIKGKEPVIAIIKYIFMVDHYVTILKVADDKVEIGDPLKGKIEMYREDFEKIWRKGGLTISRKK